MTSTPISNTKKPSRKIPLILLFCFGIAVLTFKLVSLTSHEEEVAIGSAFDIVSLAPDSSAEEIETNISRPLEALLSEIDTVKHVYSSSGRGKAVVTVQFKQGQTDEEAFKVLKAHLSQHQATLPNAVHQAVITPLKTMPELVFTLWSNTLSLTDFNDVITQVKNSVCNMPMVTECEMLKPFSTAIPPNSETANNATINVSVTNREDHDKNKETEAVVRQMNDLQTNLISQNIHIEMTRNDDQSQSAAQLMKTLMHFWLDLIFTMLFIVLLVWLWVGWKTALMTLALFPMTVVSGSLLQFFEVNVQYSLVFTGFIILSLSVIMFRFSGFRYLQALLGAMLLVVASALLFSLVINSYTNDTKPLFPTKSLKNIHIAIDLPENTQSEKTVEFTQKIAKELGNIPEIIAIQTYTGKTQQNSTRNKPWFTDIYVILDSTSMDTRRSDEAIHQDIRNRITPLTQEAKAKIQIIKGL